MKCFNVLIKEYVPLGSKVKLWWATVRPIDFKYNPLLAYYCYDTEVFRSKAAALFEAREFVRWKGGKIARIFYE